MRVIGEVFSTSKVPVGIVNITQLSDYRKEAHTQIYKQWNPLTRSRSPTLVPPRIPGHLERAAVLEALLSLSEGRTFDQYKSTCI